MKTLDTLVEDIYALFKAPHKASPENTALLGKAIGDIVSDRMRQDPYEARLRMSNLGSNCDRKLWYQVNTPEDSEELPPEVRIKFLFGDILEQLLLFWAREAGHSVTGEQDTLTINGVEGHRDAVIDGVTVDAKSASTYSYIKFANGLKPDTDAFGYIDQLNSYVYAGLDDPLVSDKNRGAFLVIDKTLGKICLDVHERNDKDYNGFVDVKRTLLAKENPPPRGFFPEDKGKSGNQGLGTECSYCSFKGKCWPQARTFLYSSGPEYLTRVIVTPKVPEV